MQFELHPHSCACARRSEPDFAAAAMAADPGDRCSLSPGLAEVARRELNETPAARTECLIQLRRKLSRYDSGSLRYGNDEESGSAESGTSEGDARIPDDAFLLRFLRSRKFNVQRSLATYQNYLQFFRDHPEISCGLDEDAGSRVRHVWDAGVVGGLKERDLHGRAVLVTFPGRWDPSRHSLWDVLLALVLQLEYMIASEETQVRGFVMLADFAEFSLYQVRALKPWYFQTMSTLMQNAFPARFKGVYIINQPWYMSIPLSIVRPFLSEKIKTRVNLLGRDTTVFHTHFKLENLPSEFGGFAGAYEGRGWAELVIWAHSQKKLLQYIGQVKSFVEY